MWGLREEKHNILQKNDISTTKWSEVQPRFPFYLFVPRDERLQDQYQRYLAVTDIFPINGNGVKTHRDRFVLDVDKEALTRRIRMFRDKSLPDELVRESLGLKAKTGWKIADSRKAIIEDTKWEEKITQLLYRPFDVRWIFYRDEVIDRPRRDIMRHMYAGKNIGLLAPRQVLSDFHHVLCTSHMANVNALDTAGRFGSGSLFPLYLYPDADKKDLLSHLGKPTEKTPNLKPALLRVLKEAYHRQPRPEDVFYYVYAVLYSSKYRTKYAEALKTDFPRVPFAKDRELFIKLAKLGERLVDLHLLKSDDLNKPICRFQGKGDNRVERQAYNGKEKRVYINKTQYFEGVELGVWEYRIGGYQVLDKWLKDRRKRILNLDDIKHYCRVVTALAKTIEVQGEIDKLYPNVEKDIVLIG